MTSKLKFEKLQLYVYQMKASNPGNLKTDIEYMFDPLVTSNDPSWPLMASKQKIKKTVAFMHIKWKIVTQAVKK